MAVIRKNLRFYTYFAPVRGFKLVQDDVRTVSSRLRLPVPARSRYHPGLPFPSVHSSAPDDEEMAVTNMLRFQLLL